MTGVPLGSAGPPVPVDTGIYAEKPSLLGRLFGRRPPGMVIYVCCRECAAKVQADPAPFLVRVMVERGGGRIEDSRIGTEARGTQR